MKKQKPKLYVIENTTTVDIHMSLVSPLRNNNIVTGYLRRSSREFEDEEFGVNLPSGLREEYRDAEWNIPVSYKKGGFSGIINITLPLVDSGYFSFSSLGRAVLSIQASRLSYLYDALDFIREVHKFLLDIQNSGRVVLPNQEGRQNTYNLDLNIIRDYKYTGYVVDTVDKIILVW